MNVERPHKELTSGAVISLPSGDDQARSMALARATQHIDAHQEGEDTFVITYEDSDPARARTLLTTLVQNYIQLRTAEQASRSAQTAATQNPRTSPLPAAATLKPPAR